MNKLTLENTRIEDHKIYDTDGNFVGEILYEYIRGSRLYNINLEGFDSDGNPLSDEDHGGVYIMTDNRKLGLGLDYQNEIKDEKNDNCLWELGRFMELVLTSNPTVLEALFVPEDRVIYEHPVMKELRSHKNEFVSKACFKPYYMYSKSQISKARGQDKKIHWDIEQMKRKTPLDFCYTFKGQGSQPISDWLDENGLDQRNCGLVNVLNMPDMYGVYYDWGQHFRLDGTVDMMEFMDTDRYEKMRKFVSGFYFDGYADDYELELWYEKNSTPKGGYTGIISPDEDSNAIRFCSVPDKNERPVCFMSYNANGYATHCRKYKEYLDWKNHRNKTRYESNLEGEKSGNPDLMYDSKNMMHCFRMISMAKEIAEGKGIILDRTGIDKDFLMDVRMRRYGYSELMKRLEEMSREMDEAIQNSVIRENIDPEFVNNLLLNARKQWRETNDL